MKRAVGRSLVLATMVAIASVSAWADEVRLVASNAVKEVIQELAPEFEARTGHRLLATWGGTPDVIRAAEEGRPFDLVVISLAAVTDLERRGKLEPGAHRELAPGQSVGEALAQGRGELGFTQVSELLSVKGISYLGPLGPEVQRVTVFSFGVRPGATQTPASKRLVDFLTSPEVASRV